MKSYSFLTAFTYRAIRYTVGPIIKAIWIKKVIGIKNIPKRGSVILAFNHQSFFDFLCFVAATNRNVHFLSAEKFFDHKLWRVPMKLTGQIRVDRNSHDKSQVHHAVMTHLVKGDAIGIFPEGTRSPHKDKMLKAFTGVAKYALEHGVPVIPIGIQGTYDIMNRDRSYPSLKKEVVINIGRSISFSDHHGKHDDLAVRTLVTEKVMKEIERLSEKEYPHYELVHEA